MKAFKSFCSFFLVIAVLFCMGVCAFAYSETSYSIELPYDFSEMSSTGGAKIWINDDRTTIVNAVVMENQRGDDKLNPADFDDNALREIENKYKGEFVKKNPDSDVEIVSVSSSLMELEEHNAIRIRIAADLGAPNDVAYYYVYYFETENYIHAFTVVGVDEDVSDYADAIIKTVRIKDEPIDLISERIKSKIHLIAWIVGVAAICLLVVVTWIRIKRKGIANDPRKWLYICPCIAAIIAIIITVIIRAYNW